MNTKILIVSFVIAFLVLFVTEANSQTAGEKAALTALQAAWPQTGWDLSKLDQVCINNSPTFQNWEGVQCRGGRITDIDISDKGISGTIPDAINGFESMRFWRLSGNKLYGSISSQFLDNVQVLDLSDNQFTGTIPDSVIALKNNLLNVQFHDNLLWGVFPVDFVNSANLFACQMNNNLWKCPVSFPAVGPCGPNITDIFGNPKIDCREQVASTFKVLTTTEQAQYPPYIQVYYNTGGASAIMQGNYLGIDDITVTWGQTELTAADNLVITRDSVYNNHNITFTIPPGAPNSKVGITISSPTRGTILFPNVFQYVELVETTASTAGGIIIPPTLSTTYFSTATTKDEQFISGFADALTGTTGYVPTTTSTTKGSSSQSIRVPLLFLFCCLIVLLIGV